MYSNDYMYAIERNDEYLAHYGIRGMKWGVRKAIASGNSARLSRQYAKAQKKLAKLEKQASKSKKYARRAALMGAGAAAAGGLAAVGTSGVGAATKWMGKAGSTATKGLANASAFAGKGIHKGLAAIGKGSLGNKIHKNLDAASRGLNYASERSNAFGVKTGNAIQRWGKQTHDISGATERVGKAFHQGAAKVGAGSIGNSVHKTLSGTKTISNNTIARIGAGAIGAGLAVGAARNAYKAATAKKKAERFRSEMNKAFAGTQYAKGGNRQGGKKRRRR